MFSSTGSLSTTIDMDWRFAELVADTWIEPELAVRYAADPVAVLAEYGIAATAHDAPALPVAPDIELVIEDFRGADGSGFPTIPLCLICSVDSSSAEPVLAGAPTAG